MKPDTRENVQYITAIGTLISGVLMCFLSFFLNEYEIETGVLMYFGQTLIFCGAVFGLNIMIKTKVLEAATKLKEDMNEKLDRIERDFKEEESKRNYQHKEDETDYIDPPDMKDM